MHDDGEGVVGGFIVDGLALGADLFAADADDSKEVGRVGGDAEIGPAGVVKLGDGAGLAAAGEGDLTDYDGGGVPLCSAGCAWW